MKTLFSTPADLLPDELQVLRETLWECWESDALPRETWLKQIGARAHPQPQEAFDAFVGGGCAGAGWGYVQARGGCVMNWHSATMMAENLEKAADRVDFELGFLSEADHVREVAALEIYLLQIAERLRISREGK